MADLPRRYGAPTTVWRRLKTWQEDGTWLRLWRTILGRLDGSFAPAKKGGEAVGLTRKGKGTKWMLMVDGQGLPLGLHLASAQQAEVTLAAQALDAVRVPRPHGRPKQRPERLVADRAYDSAAFRHLLRRRGIGMCIPPKRRLKTWRPKRGRPVVARREEYARRWVVERTFAWLGNYRRALIRWERLLAVYQGFMTVALLLLCVNRLLR